MTNKSKEGSGLGTRIAVGAARGLLKGIGRGLVGTATPMPDIPQQLPGQRNLNVVIESQGIVAPMGGAGGSDAVEVLNTLKEMGVVDDNTAVELLAARLAQMGLRTQAQQQFLEEQHLRQQQGAFMDFVAENGPPLRPGLLKAADIVRFHRARRQVKRMAKGKEPNSSLIRSW